MLRNHFCKIQEEGGAVPAARDGNDVWGLQNFLNQYQEEDNLLLLLLLNQSKAMLPTVNMMTAGGRMKQDEGESLKQLLLH